MILYNARGAHLLPVVPAADDLLRRQGQLRGICMYIYIYIYRERERERRLLLLSGPGICSTCVLLQGNICSDTGIATYHISMLFVFHLGSHNKHSLAGTAARRPLLLLPSFVELVCVV